jgi:hypothetical protein
MMVLYGKKTWWMLRPEVLDATEWTVDSGYDNERVDVTPLSHPHLPWVRADLYPGDVLVKSKQSPPASFVESSRARKPGTRYGESGVKSTPNS